MANNSANVSQGDNQQNKISGSNITIGSTFSEKSNQLEKLDLLIESLKRSGDDGELKDATRQFENIKEELSDVENPDRDLISKWLDKAKKLVSFAEIGSEVFDKAKTVYESFGIAL